MSDLLTHWALFDDARRLLHFDSHVDPLLLEILDETERVARLGALARGGTWWTGRILRAARDDQKPANARWRQKLGFGLGGLLHFPADYEFKPMIGAMMSKTGLSKREVSAYFDCHVFREVYASGDAQPFTRFLLAQNATQPGREMEAFVYALFQRALLSAHTLAPDKENFDEWMDNLLDQIQPFTIDIELYTDVWANPDAAKIEALEVETSFYRAENSLIQLAKRAREGGAVAHSELDEALRNADASGYPNALRMCVEIMREASAFWRGQTDETPDVGQNKVMERANAAAGGKY